MAEVLLKLVEEGRSDYEICQGDYVKNLKPGDRNVVIKTSGARQLTALSFAASLNLNKLLSQLLDAGCDPNIGNPSALHYAASSGNINTVRQLIKHGADVNIRDAYDQTPLFFARNAETVHYLLDHAANTDLRNTADQTPLHTLAFNGCSESLTYLMKVLPKEMLDWPDRAGRTCLHHAEYHFIQVGDPHCVALLLTNGANHLCKTNKGIVIQTETMNAAITHAKHLSGAVMSDVNIEEMEQNIAENAVAAKLQAAARGKMARKKVDEKKQQMKQEEEAAATRVQNLYRGKMARKQVGAKRHQKARKEQEKELQEVLGAEVTIDEAEKAAQKMQAGFRGRKARDRVDDLKVENRYSKPFVMSTTSFRPPDDRPQKFTVTIKKESTDDTLGLVFLNGESHFQHNFPSVPAEYAPKCLVVTRIGLGAVVEHNRTMAEASNDLNHQIRVYDRILAVNKEQDVAKMIAAMHNSQTLEFELSIERYPTTFRVSLDRSAGKKIGLSFDRKYSKTHLRVLHVKGGSGGEAEAGGDGGEAGGEPVEKESRETYAKNNYEPTTVVMAHNVNAAKAGKHWQCLQRNQIISEVNGETNDATSLGEVMRDAKTHPVLHMTVHRGSTQARRDLAEMLFSPAHDLYLRPSKLRNFTGVTRRKPKTQAEKKAADKLYTQNMSRQVTQNKETGENYVSALSVVSPKQKKAREQMLEKAVAVEAFMKMQQYWEKAVILSINLKKTETVTKFGISFFDGGQAFTEANRGLAVDAPAHLVVKSVVWGGLLHNYNEAQTDANKKVIVGDRIVAVNGVKDDVEAMKEELRTGDDIMVQVQKFSRYFSFYTKKVSGDIGLGLQMQEHSGLRSELKIGKVYGVTQVINKRLVQQMGRYDLVLEPYMRLIGVNGRVDCDATELRQEIADAKEGSWLKLQVRRAAVLKLAVMKVRKQVMAMMFLRKMSFGGPPRIVFPNESDSEEEEDEDDDDDDDDEEKEEEEEEDD
ncbi:unnamed protein product [Amoebophrya sp. A120]|nr:unnamed protein product [Amoebophrya sp. A120]|eukprot:GSA120T00001133001.1